MSATEVRHPIFARFFDRFSHLMERDVGEHRDELLAGLSGCVVEVGAGSGLNFGHYPTNVTQVLAIEPESYLRGVAEAAVADAHVPVTVVDGAADDLPASAGEFDAGVVSLVLCSVKSPASALGQLFRVIRPGGELRFYEHVRSPKPGFARAQRALDLVWPWFGGGCHTSRDTEHAIADAGFVIERVRHFSFRPAPCAAPVSPHIIGVARRP
jgi:ubiquinone/menaquinone biosynthesis C-methylase UbiE